MDDETELTASNSIIGTRQKRSNAGNRMKTLLQMQEPLEDEEQIFAEVEDDQEFDVEASDEDEGEDEGEGEGDGEGDGDDDGEGEPGDDENFSDSSDSSIENDEEPEDAGEQTLLKQQKEELKERRRAEKRKMFEIKPRDRGAPPAKARKFVAKAESLLDSERRVSKRTLAIQNKERVIERLRENERRKAEYVSPVIKKAPKLTQEQRLEEAKITELKNTASLNQFVEIEEYRKQQQRLMWANRRPKLSNFIRYSSRSMLEYPGIIDYTEPEVKEEAVPLTPGDSKEATPVPEADGREPSEEPSEEPAEEPTEEPEPTEPTDLIDPTEATEPTETTEEPLENEPGIELETEPFEIEPPIKEEMLDDAALIEQKNREQKEESDEEKEEIIRDVEGPPTISSFNAITMHKFPDHAYNKHTVKGVFLGSQVLKSSAVPPKRICPVTGHIARYLDPSTGIAYYSLKTKEVLNMICDHEIAWSNELGGVYLGLRGGQRHARGVPDGFD